MKKVLISGAGIAGPALAFWLSRSGFECAIIERAPALRTGGQAVDFRGPIHRKVLELMDLWEPIHRRRTRPGDLVILDRIGDPIASLPAVMTAGDVEILRGDLCELLFERTRSTTAYRFGDHVARLADHDDRVDVTFASGREESFDLVIGADGLHSGVRALAFGDEQAVLRHHGYRLATFTVPDSLGVGSGSELYSRPGRAASIGTSGRGQSRALLVFKGDPFGEERRDLAAQKSMIREVYDGMRWRVPDILDALDDASDLYIDAIASIDIDRYSRGRVALLGDAAYGGTLGGQGSSLAIVGGYVLAGELCAGGNASDAFLRYEERMRPYATRCQKGASNAGAFFAPKSQLGLSARNAIYWLFTTKLFRGFFEWLVKDAATDFALPEYASGENSRS